MMRAFKKSGTNKKKIETKNCEKILWKTKREFIEYRD